MKTPFITSIIAKAAAKIEAVVLADPECPVVGQITFKNGNRTFFRNHNFNINCVGSVDIAKDKGCAHFFMKHFGYSVAEGQTFFKEELCKIIAGTRNIDEGFDYAKQLGFPVIVKPINLSQGILVTKVHNKREYYQVAKKILQTTSGFIVERFYQGNDYRIVVLDKETIAAYQRIPLFIVGDAKSTILELIQNKKEFCIKNGRKIMINLEDFRIKKKLQRQKLSFNSVVPQDTIVYLLDNANLSAGGEAVDVTEKVHPDFQELAVNITKDMGLRLAGVDILTSDIRLPIEHYIILEVNGSPSLSHYASIGDIQTQRVEDLYVKVLQALEIAQHSN